MGTKDIEPRPTGAITVPATVLIVEDDAMIAAQTEFMLLDLGASDIHKAATVEEAMQAMDARRFDLAVLDLVLGEESGLTVAERCFAENVPVVFATGFGHLQLPKAYGSVRLLRKPYTLADMERAVEARFSGTPGR